MHVQISLKHHGIFFSNNVIVLFAFRSLSHLENLCEWTMVWTDFIFSMGLVTCVRTSDTVLFLSLKCRDSQTETSLVLDSVLLRLPNCHSLGQYHTVFSKKVLVSLGISSPPVFPLLKRVGCSSCFNLLYEFKDDLVKL